jgi:hypothetical protein
MEDSFYKKYHETKIYQGRDNFGNFVSAVDDSSFETLALSMRNITDNGYIKKMVSQA